MGLFVTFREESPGVVSVGRQYRLVLFENRSSKLCGRSIPILFFMRECPVDSVLVPLFRT